MTPRVPAPPGQPETPRWCSKTRSAIDPKREPDVCVLPTGHEGRCAFEDASSARVSEPTQTCKLCGRVVVVRASGRGFPPDTAERTLRKWCNAAGCKSEPVYRAGFGLMSRYVGQGGRGGAEPKE